MFFRLFICSIRGSRRRRRECSCWKRVVRFCFFSLRSGFLYFSVVIFLRLRLVGVRSCLGREKWVGKEVKGGCYVLVLVIRVVSGVVF